LKPLPNELLALIIKINLTTNYQLLLNCNKVYRAGGGLGMLNVKPVKSELIDETKLYHARPLPDPQSLEATIKKKVKRLTDIDVFNISLDSEWAAPTLIQAKKTCDVRILTYFRIINAQIKRKKCPLPKISDLLKKLSGFKYAMAIDLIMGYYHLPLDLEAPKLYALIHNTLLYLIIFFIYCNCACTKSNYTVYPANVARATRTRPACINLLYLMALLGTRIPY
jgi:hypothetical protein